MVLSSGDPTVATLRDRRIVGDRDDHILIRTEPITFYICLIDSIHSGCIVRVFIFSLRTLRAEILRHKIRSETFNVYKKRRRRHRHRYGVGEMSF